MSRYTYPYKKLENSELKWIALSKLKPPHFVPKSECLELISSMESDGWNRRPLIGFWVKDKVQCITGSHRIKAAKYADLQGAPVYIFSKELMKELKKLGLTTWNYCEFFYCRGEVKWAGLPGFGELARLLAIDFRDKIWTTNPR
jgi:hypothetical protein